MKLDQILESKVQYTTQPNRRLRVNEKISFSQLKQHPGILKHSGPNTTVVDVTDEERVKKAPGENKWNAISKMYWNDDDEIVCANTGDNWICVAINVKI